MLHRIHTDDKHNYITFPFGLVNPAKRNNVRKHFQYRLGVPQPIIRDLHRKDCTIINVRLGCQVGMNF